MSCIWCKLVLKVTLSAATPRPHGVTLFCTWRIESCPALNEMPVDYCGRRIGDKIIWPRRDWSTVAITKSPQTWIISFRKAIINNPICCGWPYRGGLNLGRLNGANHMHLLFGRAWLYSSLVYSAPLIIRGNPFSVIVFVMRWLPAGSLPHFLGLCLF